MNVRELLTEGTGRLSVPVATANITAPGLDASLLLAHTLLTRREKLILHYDEPVTENDILKYRGYLSRRINGECTAYILGYREFYGHEFLVNQNVLVPRPDTETLLEAVIDYIDTLKNKNLSVLDLCTGSGALAISLKHEMPFFKITASDISAEAIETAKQNAGRLLCGNTAGNRTGNIVSNAADPINFIQSDLFKNIKEKFDIIMTNPPYVKTGDLDKLSPEVRGEPVIALDGGEDGLDLIKKITVQTKEHLIPGGVIMLEADARQMKTIYGLLEKNGLKNMKIYKDLAGLDRVISSGPA